MRKIYSYIHDSLQAIYSPEELRNLSKVVSRDILKVNKQDVYLRKDIKLSRRNRERLESVVERLKKHEPIQYVSGWAYFYGLQFKVKPGVLIPRPETEELVDLILHENKGPYSLLDIGTGSGCIAISIAKNNPEAKVEAWDFSEEALKMARNNNKRLGTKARFRKQNILTYNSRRRKFDIIVSNPPYVTESEKMLMDKNVLHWEPEEALFVQDHNPLLFYNRIGEVGLFLLSKGGKLYFEINQAYGSMVAKLLEQKGYKNVQVLKDLFGKDRIVTAER